ncbi:hypothetical protein ABC977_00295 [Thioalkalicoccus limnaeus]|uniref:Uncharacterized protein n=1 Tax=Thioalkalicoccus limnaeus TaxID=120681 RepID=A0ABV4B941_9GAMM
MIPLDLVHRRTSGDIDQRQLQCVDHLAKLPITPSLLAGVTRENAVISAADTSTSRFGRTAAANASARITYHRRCAEGTRVRSSADRYRSHPDGCPCSRRGPPLLAKGPVDDAKPDELADFLVDIVELE